MKQVYIGLGSNLEQPLVQLKQAIRAIARLPHTRVQTDSGYYSSKPMGPQDQPDYLNAVVLIETKMAPLVLLAALQSIESQQGRIRRQRWGARCIDLDILLYADEQISLPQLQVPHPGLCERDFVFMPLLKINPHVNIPGKGALKKIVDTLLHQDKLESAGLYAASYQGSIEYKTESE